MTIEERVERWFAAHFYGSPHMRDTETYNHVRAAVDALKAELADLEGGNVADVFRRGAGTAIPAADPVSATGDDDAHRRTP